MGVVSLIFNIPTRYWTSAVSEQLMRQLNRAFLWKLMCWIKKVKLSCRNVFVNERLGHARSRIDSEKSIVGYV